MLSTSAPSIVRSSLEEMLDSIRQRDEEDKPNDFPPELPARPTSRARRPATKRSLPKHFLVDTATDTSTRRKRYVNRPRVGSLGGKKDKELLGESPYISIPEEMECEQRLEEKDSVNLVATEPSSSMLKSRESEQDDNIGYFIKKKLRVWCRCPNGLWELGLIQPTSGDKATVSLLDGTVVKVSAGELVPANPDILEGVDDLIQLSYLNEPSVLHNLQYRYSHDIIYSKAGPVLIAINPFKDVHCYGNDFVTAYREKLFENPHIYAIADSAYNEMMRDQINQSIIISGESGSGKTETAKIAMQYLAAVGGGSGGVEREILHTNSILEAFGNAKTSRNDNSSRFGKLIEIHFSATGKMCGAEIQTFLLEKSRVVQIVHGERSYHIFYQLCAGAPSCLKGKLNLKMASEFNYLSQSECLVIDDVDDARQFQNLSESLDAVRIPKEDQEHAFEMLAAVLWLGNISFQVIDNESCVEVVADEAITNAARLMGCRTQDLLLALSTRTIQAGKDNVAKKLTLQQAIDARDALAKFIYASLFSWLVEEINKLLVMGKQHTGRSISILDIYGFESFKKNSFEQFCINYANERLQQHFNRHLFKLEQEEYELDGIDWTRVDFEDNQECLDLFEKKPIGLLSLLDEESNFPKATDLTFANKLNQHLNGNPCFKGERGGGFSIRHYAGEVLYDTHGFLEKNRDPLHSDTVQLLSSCSCRLPKMFASGMLKQSHKSASHLRHMGLSGPHKQSVAAKFKGQLFKLMQQLETSTPHFIRCIKPNNKQLPGIYDKDLVLEQLRCCGVVEVVRISRAGYPTRMTHREFARRYGFLLVEDNDCQDPLSISVAVLQQFDVLPDMYQVGFTKLYFRTGQIAALEYTRKQVLQGTLEVQKRFRGLRARRHFRELKKGVVTLQSFIRGENHRKEYNLLIKLKEQAARKTIEEQLGKIINLQSVIRGCLARRHFNYLDRLKKLSRGSTKQKPGGKVSEAMEALQEPDGSSVLQELRRRVTKAEATLGEKEQENAALRDQLWQYEIRWSECEAKMKSMEEKWQRQMASLQASLEAAKRSRTADKTARLEEHSSPHHYDSEDNMSMGAPTPAGAYSGRCVGSGGEINSSFGPVNHLSKEFERQKHDFDEEAKAIAEAKSGHPDEELRKLKLRFQTWKRDYKSRLKETKAKLKLGQAEGRRRWWGSKIKNGLARR